MSGLDQAESDKIAALEQAVINGTPDEVAKLYKELGDVILTAHILGIACRFRGLEMVKVLVENGASFRYAADTLQYKYADLFGDSYVTLYSDYFTLFLIKDVNRTYERSLERYLNALSDREGSSLKTVCEKERIQVVKYLCDNADKSCFRPGDLLYFAILIDDRNILAALREKGVTISEGKKKMLTEGGGGDAWHEYSHFIEWTDDDDFMRIMSELLLEIGTDQKMHFTDGFGYNNRHRFFAPEFFAFFMEHFNQSKMNKTKLLKMMVDRENVPCLEIAAKHGWLKTPRKRDEMIQYAMDNKKTECTAFLLEFKNRTADLAAEQEKAEKKLIRELNMSPDAVAALKKIWSYRKREDGTGIITNYKGTNTTVTVPEKIGKDIVTAIGDGAFAAHVWKNSYHHRMTSEQKAQHNEIVKITLPETLQYIGNGAFQRMFALEEISIPEGVKEIGSYAFEECRALQSMTIPGTVEKIGERAFELCSKLEQVCIREGVKEIGEGTFLSCSVLKHITIPGTVENIGKYAFANCNELQQACIGEGVKEIDEYAFLNCIVLKTVTLPDTVGKVGKYAFVNNFQLEEVCIGEGVKEIGEVAFQGCRTLKTVTIPNSVGNIGKYAFAGCSALEQVRICGEVMRIGTHAFLNCGNLKEIIIQKSIPSRILGEIATQCPNVLIYCPKGSNTEAYCKKKGIKYNLDYLEVQDEYQAGKRRY